MARGSGVSTPDKDHLHHRLMRLGHGPRRAVVILWLWTALLSGQFRNFLTETNNNGAVSVVDVREKYYEVVPVTELGAGM